MNLTNRMALITGASRGIGEAIAAQFLNSGAAGITITSRREENITAAADRLDDDRVLPLAARADSEADADAKHRRDQDADHQRFQGFAIGGEEGAIEGHPGERLL